jgi:outer membrane protein
MRSLRLVAFLAIPMQVMIGQQPTSGVPSGLTLEEAIGIARRNNPAFLQTSNALKNADMQVRVAYGSLLPSSSAQFGTRYQQGGTQIIQGAALGANGDTKQTSYWLGLNYSIGAAALYAPRAAKAQRDAAEANIVDGSEALRSVVTTQYINVLQAQARAAIQDTLVTTAEGQLELAKARMAVGAATALDTKRAEVGLGQAQVASINAHNTAEIEMLRLFQQLGVPKPGAVRLTTEFPISQPKFSLDSLLSVGRQENPALKSFRANERSAEAGVKVAKSSYTPSLGISTSWSGNSIAYADPEFAVLQAQNQTLGALDSCIRSDSIRTRVGLASLNCTSRFSFTDADAAAARAANSDKFPFKFNRSPVGISAGLSIPLFDNFRREQSVQQAQVTRDNARYSTKARELQLTTEVTQQYLNLMAAVQTVALQEQVAARAREELQFAQERYRVGAATFLDVTISRGNYEQASIDRVNSIYDYHKAFAALEAAVGRPLR